MLVEAETTYFDLTAESETQLLLNTLTDAIAGELRYAPWAWRPMLVEAETAPSSSMTESAQISTACRKAAASI